MFALFQTSCSKNSIRPQAIKTNNQFQASNQKRHVGRGVHTSIRRESKRKALRHENVQEKTFTQCSNETSL
jgi:hypothetical protein